MHVCIPIIVTVSVCLCVSVYLQCVALAALCDLQYECCQHVEALAVAHGFIPAGVGQQHPLQHHSVLLPLLATVGTAAGPVQVLRTDNKVCQYYFVCINTFRIVGNKA